MRLVETRFLADQKNFNFGQPAVLIEIERPEDFDALLRNILDTGYYDSAYFASHSGYEAGKLVPNFWFLAEVARALQPKRAFEVGCGRGDVLHLLKRSGVEVGGVDFSADVLRQAWPEVRDRLHAGDLEATCRARAAAGERYDLLLGFDIWEHLLPRSLDGAIEAAVSLLSDEGLCFFVVPAFGPDAVFGESFPLEFEETRAAFDGHQPFTHLLAERTEPPIPASGHLVWAHTLWWQKKLEAHGLVRMPALERALHRWFDPFLPRSNRSFYLFRRATPEAEAREARLAAAPYSWGRLARCVAGFSRATYWTGEIRAGLLRHVVAQRTPERWKALYRRARGVLRRASNLASQRARTAGPTATGGGRA